MTITLGLDISSSSTGYAVFDSGKLVKAGLGTIPLKHKTHGERLIDFEKEINRLIKEYKPNKVLVEDIWRGPNPRTLQVLAYYHGAVRKVLFQLKKIEPIVLTTTEIRRLLESKHDAMLVPSKKIRKAKKINKSSKELTFDFIKKKYSLKEYTFKKHNDITDAIALCYAFHIKGDDNEGSISGARGRSKRKRG